jgi:DnaJ-class molecular chaperone
MKKSVTFKDIEKARKKLGLKDTASMEEVKNSYRSLMLKFHPDRYSGSKDKDIY